MTDIRFDGKTRRATGALLLGGLVLLGTIATAAAFNGRGGAGTVPPATSAPSHAPATPAPTEVPVVTPDPTPDPTPELTPAPTPEPTPVETDGGTDAMPIKVDLDNATGADVYVDIVDNSGTVVGAVSGTPGDGVSVEVYTLKIENIDERTLRLTWIDYPIDNALTLYINGDASRFVLIQPEPTAETDAIGFDRELILTFDHDISAADIEANLQDGIDTPGVE